MQVTDAWSRATPPGIQMGVTYLTIRNRTGKPDELIAATTPRASSVELHASKVSNGVSSMQRQASLSIDSDAVVRLEPGELHFMLMGVAQPLVGGERFPLTLRFASSPPVTIDVQVRANGQ